MQSYSACNQAGMNMHHSRGYGPPGNYAQPYSQPYAAGYPISNNNGGAPTSFMAQPQSQPQVIYVDRPQNNQYGSGSNNGARAPPGRAEGFLMSCMAVCCGM